MSPSFGVIGAGISGLAAAVELRSRGVEVNVFEASERAGGPIYTDRRRDGYTIDAGPDSFLSTKPGGIELAERLRLTDEILCTRPDGGGTFIVRDGRMQPLPEGITMLVPTQFRQILESPLLGVSGKARLLADYLIPARRGDADESVASFMQRRVGRQAFERLAEPLLSGIFAGDAGKLSIQSTFPRLREAERRHGGLIRAALAARRNAPAGTMPQRRHTPFVSFRQGLGALVETAVEHVGPNRLHLSTSIASLEPAGQGYRLTSSDGRIFEVDGVVVATPAPVASRLLATLAPDASQSLTSIPYVSSATVSMAFRERDSGPKHGGRGFVVPRIEGFDLTAVTWSSRKFAGRAPDGEVLLRGFVGRAGNEGPAFLPNDQVIETVRRDLAAITGIRAEPLFARVYRWHNAMPQYHVGHGRIVSDIERELSGLPGIELAGAAYHGVGIPDCITAATSAAARLVDRLDIQ